MPSGHASHKSTSDKPNVNASGQINSDQDISQDIQPKSGSPRAGREEEGHHITEATERPDRSSQDVTEAPEES